MRVHLIRHGETVTSGKTYAGRRDVALSERGREQAKEIARDLSGCPIGLILTSPLSRAKETARPLANALSLDPVEEPALMEIDFGRYEGRPKRDLGLKLRETHAFASLPGGESLFDVWERAGHVLWLLESAGLPGGTQAAVFGHFWINRLLFGRAGQLDFDKACRSRGYRPSTGSVCAFDCRKTG